MFSSLSRQIGIVKRNFIFVGKFDKWRIALLLLLVTLLSAFPYIQNGLVGKLIDQTIALQNGTTGIRETLVIILSLIIATTLPNLIFVIRSYTATIVQFNTMREIDLHFLKKASELDIATIESTEYQELQQKARERGGTTSLSNLLSMCIENLGNLVAVLLSLLILVFIDKILLLYAIIGSSPVLYVQLKYGNRMSWILNRNSKYRRKYSNRKGHLEESLELTEVKLYQLAKKFLHDIREMLDSFNNELKGVEKSRLIWNAFAQLVFSLFVGFGIWRIINLTINGDLLVGQMLFAFATYRGFKNTLADFFKKTAEIGEFTNYADYLYEIEDLQPKIRNLPHAEKVDFAINPPTIEFKNVTFKYDEQREKNTIDNLSFKITGGEKIAIVGLSGAGKTTLIKLLCRVYDPLSGQILINGKDLREINLESWQKQLAVLFQDFATYESPVREAIAIGKSDTKPDDSRVIQAAKMSRADIFIENLPKKYDQLLWKGYEDGVDLSKGERQRMALARVLYRESPITILDEPTASVDALAEQEIFETLEKLPENRSVILISHRFSTVKNANKILVIEHGKLIEEGKHEELMSKNGRYAHLYKIQADSYK